MSTAEATDRIVAMGQAAAAAGTGVQVSVQSAFGCGFEGAVPRGARARSRAALPGRGLDRASAWPTRRATRIPPRSSGSSARSARSMRRLTMRVPLPRHVRAGAGQRLRRAGAPASRSFESAFGGPRRLPVHGGRGGQRLHRGPRAPAAAAWAAARHRRSRPSSRWRSEVAAFFGRELPGVVHRTGPIPYAGGLIPRPRCDRDETARRRPRARPDQRPGRAVRHAAPGAARAPRSSRSRTRTGGDLARKLGNVPALNQELMGTSFLAQNANKKSLTLNLKIDEGAGDLPAARGRRRRRRRELPARRDDAARRRLRDAARR